MDSNAIRHPNCHMRSNLGNCLPIGGFCTSVNEPICEAFHKLSKHGEWVHDYSIKPTPATHIIKCPFCGMMYGSVAAKVIKFCNQCGAELEDNRGEDDS